MQDPGCLGLVHCDDPERWYGEGSGRGVQDWELMYTCGGFMLMYAKPIQYCKVKFLKKDTTAKNKNRNLKKNNACKTAQFLAHGYSVSCTGAQN